MDEGDVCDETNEDYDELTCHDCLDENCGDCGGDDDDYDDEGYCYCFDEGEVCDMEDNSDACDA